MHCRFFWPALSFLLVLFLLPALAQASVQKAIIFPDTARVWQESQLPLQSPNQEPYLQFQLPAQAQPETLQVSLDNNQKLSVRDIQYTKVQPDETEAVQKLRSRIQELQDKKDSSQAEIKAWQKRISFWEAQAAFQDKDLQELEKLSERIYSSLQEGYARQNELAEEIETLQDRIKDLEAKLQDMTGPEQAAWEVTLHLEGQDIDQSVQVEYDYILSDCGWEPQYRIEGRPGQQELLFSQKARVWQSSGRDWQDTDLSLATMQPPRTLDPPRIPDWEVGPEEKVRPMARTDMMLAREAAPESAQPDLERLGVYSVWHLGKQDLQAGQKPSLHLQEEAWPAEFVRLLRPSQGQEAFVQADIQLQEARDMPPGEAVFLLDGAVLGKRDFSMQGREQTLHLGPDPFVTASLTTRDKKSGAKGWLRGKQTYYWDFLLQIKNEQDYPVQIKLEEPRPRIRDERIEAEFSFRPEPAEQTESLFIWKLELDKEQQQDIEIEIEMQAPEDMDVDWGWRR